MEQMQISMHTRTNMQKLCNWLTFKCGSQTFQLDELANFLPESLNILIFSVLILHASSKY